MTIEINVTIMQCHHFSLTWLHFRSRYHIKTKYNITISDFKFSACLSTMVSAMYCINAILINFKCDMLYIILLSCLYYLHSEFVTRLFLLGFDSITFIWISELIFSMLIRFIALEAFKLYNRSLVFFMCLICL